jgi:YqaJ-like viral recombinase domain
MGDDEAALLRLWREKRGEAEPRDLSGNLIVQLGAVTEELNRRWYEANTGQVITNVQEHIRHPGLRWMGATLDGRIEASGAVFEAKFMLPWSFSEEAAAEKYMPQLQHNTAPTATKFPSAANCRDGPEGDIRPPRHRQAVGVLAGPQARGLVKSLPRSKSALSGNRTEAHCRRGSDPGWRSTGKHSTRAAATDRSQYRWAAVPCDSMRIGGANNH